jgi:hypothetical protein
MTTMAETARQFFDACETGQGWAGCQAFCTEGASFSAQAEPLAGVTLLQASTEWMKSLPMAPTGKSTSTDYVYVMQFDGDRSGT